MNTGKYLLNPNLVLHSMGICSKMYIREYIAIYVRIRLVFFCSYEYESRVPSETYYDSSCFQFLPFFSSPQNIENNLCNLWTSFCQNIVKQWMIRWLVFSTKHPGPYVYNCYHSQKVSNYMQGHRNWDVFVKNGKTTTKVPLWTRVMIFLFWITHNYKLIRVGHMQCIPSVSKSTVLSVSNRQSCMWRLDRI